MGALDGKAIKYLGIPFVQPPIGNLRFRTSFNDCRPDPLTNYSDGPDPTPWRFKSLSRHHCAYILSSSYHLTIGEHRGNSVAD
jgi:hypothetical protein